MPSILIRTTFALAALSAAASVFAGDVYEWKDAKGVTHYTENPPKAGAYKQRDVSSRDATTAAPTLTPAASPGTNKPVATANPMASAQCTTAQKNIELLQGKGALQQDTDGDGKPDKTLDDADRSNQLELARATLKANCGAAAKP